MTSLLESNFRSFAIDDLNTIKKQKKIETKSEMINHIVNVVIKANPDRVFHSGKYPFDIQNGFFNREELGFYEAEILDMMYQSFVFERFYVKRDFDDVNLADMFISDFLYSDSPINEVFHREPTEDMMEYINQFFKLTKRCTEDNVYCFFGAPSLLSFIHYDGMISYHINIKEARFNHLFGNSVVIDFTKDSIINSFYTRMVRVDDGIKTVFYELTDKEIVNMLAYFFLEIDLRMEEHEDHLVNGTKIQQIMEEYYDY